MDLDRITARALVDAGYMPLKDYIERFGEEVRTQRSRRCPAFHASLEFGRPPVTSLGNVWPLGNQRTAARSKFRRLRASVSIPVEADTSGSPPRAFGLTRCKYQSGEIDRTSGISRCGDQMMRAMLYEAPHIVLVCSTKWSGLKIKTAHEKTKDAKLIKLADKTSNMRAITFSPASGWSVKRWLEYIGWAREVVEGLRGGSPWLEQ